MQPQSAHFLKKTHVKGNSVNSATQSQHKDGQKTDGRKSKNSENADQNEKSWRKQSKRKTLQMPILWL